MKSSKHASKLHAGKSQQSLKTCLLPLASRATNQDQFNEELCKAMVASNIPLKKLNNTNLRSFLQKYCTYNIPEESFVRKKCVDSLYNATVLQIKKLIGDNYFYIVVDETTDSSGRYMAHLLIGVLEEEKPGISYLISSKQIDKTNNLTITRFIQDALTNFFLPNTVPIEKFLILLSDAAPYMLKAGQNLKIFYENLLHVTCLAHGINRVAEYIRSEFPLVNDLISNVKKVFLKAPLRIQFYREKLPGVPLPPQPVITRWGTWLDATVFYANNYDTLKEIICDITDSSEAVIKSQELFKDKKLQLQLVFIKVNYSFVSKTLLQLEASSVSLMDSVDLVETFYTNCKNVKGEIGRKILQKFESVIENNLGFKKLQIISKIFMGDFTETTEFKENLLPSLKFAPITSVDVERSFSIYKHMLTDRRKSFLVENFEKHIVINSFHNIKSK